MAKKMEPSKTIAIREELSKNQPLSSIQDSILCELERIESIRNNLYYSYEKSPVLKEYTNKNGSKNMVVNPAIKEYKAYSNQFNNMIKTLIMSVGSSGTGGKKKDKIQDFLDAGAED